MVTRVVYCPHCGSEEIVRNGKAPNGGTGSHEKDSSTKVEQGHRQPDPAHDTLTYEICSNALP